MKRLLWIVPVLLVYSLSAPARPDTVHLGLESQSVKNLCRESYDFLSLKPVGSVSRFLDRAYRDYPNKLGNSGKGLATDLRDYRSRRNSESSQDQVKSDKELAAWTHRFIKTVIPKFSLQKGFEVEEAIDHGYRQCLLQSVLVSSILEDGGARSGLAMVFLNPEGHESNLGHVVSVLRLSDGKDILVDASHPEPFPQQKGIFLQRAGHYRFLRPQYGNDQEIDSYIDQGNSQNVACSEVTTLSPDYVRSQFWFYRGERVPGALIERPPTPEGLKRSAELLQKSHSLCPANPLTLYFLGRVYEDLKDQSRAHAFLAQAEARYRSYGWVPDSVAQAARRTAGLSR